MAKMRFDVKCVRDCLVNNGVVFTVRAWEGYSVLSKVEVDGVGLCTKKRVMKVSRKEDLSQYLSLSGFTSLDDWWAKIASFGACGGWLFEVRVIPVSPSVAPQKVGSLSPSYREIHGDIFTSNAEVIVNTVNCIGAMGRGIALEFRKRYPDLYAAYRQACARKEIKPGHVWVYQAKGRIIFNAAVKDDWRDASRIVWVESCLKELVELCRTMKIRSLSLPWMGAMNGWIPVEQIKSSTRRILSNVSDIDISVYEIRRI